MQIDVAIDNLTTVRSGWAAVIDGPSNGVGDQDAVLNLRLRDVHINARHGWTCWGRVTGSAGGVTPPLGGGCGGVAQGTAADLVRV